MNRAPEKERGTSMGPCLFREHEGRPGRVLHLPCTGVSRLGEVKETSEPAGFSRAATR